MTVTINYIIRVQLMRCTSNFMIYEQYNWMLTASASRYTCEYIKTGLTYMEVDFVNQNLIVLIVYCSVHLRFPVFITYLPIYLPTGLPVIICNSYFSSFICEDKSRGCTVSTCSRFNTFDVDHELDIIHLKVCSTGTYLNLFIFLK